MKTNRTTIDRIGDVAETYQRWLSGRYDTIVATSGAEALEVLDDDVDVVLLDRMMSSISGDEVLSTIRAKNIDCRVAMVTAVDPDLDVIEMGFDEYVVKPPDRDQLIETIERLLDRADLDDNLQQYYSLLSRRIALQQQKSEDELMESTEYRDLLERIEMAHEAVDEQIGDMSSNVNFLGAVKEIMGDDERQNGPGSRENNQQ